MRKSGCEVGVSAALFTGFKSDRRVFAELKSFIKRNWSYYEKDTDQGVDVFLEWCVNMVGAKEESAQGHFRHAGLKIEVWKGQAMDNDMSHTI